MEITSNRTRDLLFLRHGQTDWNVEYRIQSLSDIGINERGEQQMEETAEAISDALGDRSWKGPPSIWSSPIERAVESAQVVQKVLSDNQYPVEEIHTHSGLREFDMGEFTGRTIQELQTDPHWQNYLSSPASARFPGGETMDEIRLRLRSAVDHILAEDDAESAIVVTHGGIIRLIIHSVLGMPDTHFHRIQISNGALSHLRIMPPKGVRFLSINRAPSVAPIL